MSISDQTRGTRESSLGWMIQRIARHLDSRMNERLAGLDLSLPTFAVMMIVLERGPMTQTEIGKRFGMPAYAISRALDALQEQGFVERRAHATSRRAHSIQATAAGKAIAPRLHAIVAEVNAELTSGLEQSESDAFGGLLRKILNAQTYAPTEGTRSQ